MVIQDYHHIVVAKATHHSLVSFDEREIDDGRVIGLETGDGFLEAEPEEGVSDGEGGEGGVGGEEERPGEADAVEPEGRDSAGDGVEWLLAESLRHHRLQMRHPVQARQLHPPPPVVHYPPRVGGQRLSRRDCCSDQEGQN